MRVRFNENEIFDYIKVLIYRKIKEIRRVMNFPRNYLIKLRVFSEILHKVYNENVEKEPQ